MTVEENECVKEEAWTIDRLISECDFECMCANEALKYNEGRRDAFEYIRSKLVKIKEQK